MKLTQPKNLQAPLRVMIERCARATLPCVLCSGAMMTAVSTSASPNSFADGRADRLLDTVA
eukprot:1801718-Heterocapsa_arctica.AAC.1